jgi:HEPN domain-containing protein/predicted nucleotidyltransferase
MPVTREDARKAAKSIVKTLDPTSVILFGSVAGEGIGNDLDLLVVIEDGSRTIQEAGLLLQKCLKRYYRKFSIDPFIIPLGLLNEYYAKGSPFLKLVSRQGKLLYMKDMVKQWCKQAEEELAMADYLLQGGYFKGACYHAQQAIEKAIKARLFKKGWELEKTHSIERLIAIGKDYRVKFPLSDEEIVFLDSIYRGRYPVDEGLLPLGDPSQHDAQKAVTLSQKMLNRTRG